MRDQLLTSTDPKLLLDQFTKYDPNGNLQTWIDRNGKTSTYTYDALNRISTAAYADGSIVSYTWDQANRLTQASDTAGNTISLFYDGLNDLVCATPANVTTLSACQKGGIGTVTYSYDAAGRRLTMTAVGGAGTVSYGYDAANQLRTITQGTTTITKTPDADGRPYQLALPNSLLATYAFDAASELKSITYASGSTKVGDLSYTYDLDGRVASRGGSLFMPEMPSAVSGTAYDADNRLCAWNAASPSCTSPSITWDNNGNLLNDGTYTYTWDSRNRLKSTTNGSLSFTYDALGRRLTKLSGGTTFGWVYDFDNIVEETQNGAISAHVLAGLDIDERFTRTPVSTGITSVYLTDLLGSTVGVSTSAGAVSTYWGYQAFGATSASGAANPNPYQFTGRERDLTSLYFNRARYYNPAWGRFISEDPIGFGGGINKYAYGDNDPIALTDPYGLTAGCPDPTKLAQAIDQQPYDPSNPNGPTRSSGHCLPAVRKAVGAAGGPPLPRFPQNSPTHPTQTNMIDALKDCWNKIDSDPNPKKGDISVVNKGNSGHIAVWDGTRWVSDYFQPQVDVYGPQSIVSYYSLK